MAINPETLRIERELAAMLTGVTDAQTTALVAAWVNAYETVATELDAAIFELTTAAQERGRVTRSMVLRSQRLTAARAAVAQALEQVAERTGLIITADLAQVIEHAVVAEQGMILSQLGGVRRADLAASLVRADAGQVAAMVQRATEQITALSWPIGAEAYAAVQTELLRGIAVGDNPRRAARRMLRSVEDRFEGGLQRALVVARTETLDATRAAAQAVDQANADVVAGWTWTAHFGDTRTCPACLSMHGSQFPVDQPGPQGHQQCRCARVPRTKSWAELGFEGIPDPPDAIPDAEAWFEGLSEARQVEILGPARFEAWKAGNYPMEQWATRRETDGWRPSYVVSPAPAAA